MKDNRGYLVEEKKDGRWGVVQRATKGDILSTLEVSQTYATREEAEAEMTRLLSL